MYNVTRGLVNSTVSYTNMDYLDTTKLYKYRSLSSTTLTNLANNELFFASSDSFNDPFDCRARKEYEFENDNDFIEKWSVLEASQQNISIEEAKVFVEEINSDLERKEEYLKEKSSLFQKQVLQSFGVCSFSCVNDDILMWSHYADSHRGICLEFNREPGNILEHARPIDYPDSDDFPYIDYWLGPTDEQIDELVKVILTKSKHWKYENEWRVIQRPTDIVENYKGHPFSYTEETLTGVIFGHRVKEKERHTVERILSSHSVEYYEAKPVKNKFLLSIERV